jgi:hypothetical protein
MLGYGIRKVQDRLHQIVTATSYMITQTPSAGEPTQVKPVQYKHFRICLQLEVFTVTIASAEFVYNRSYP